MGRCSHYMDIAILFYLVANLPSRKASRLKSMKTLVERTLVLRDTSGGQNMFKLISKYAFALADHQLYIEQKYTIYSMYIYGKHYMQ